MGGDWSISFTVHQSILFFVRFRQLHVHAFVREGPRKCGQTFDAKIQSFKRNPTHKGLRKFSSNVDCHYGGRRRLHYMWQLIKTRRFRRLKKRVDVFLEIT